MSKREKLTDRLDLMAQWDYEKNELNPAQLTGGSNKKVWWICDREHSWKAATLDRTKGNGCPVCAGKKVLAGFNDLQTLNPELANEWAYELNELLPSQVTTGSSKKVWWICDKGHSWKATVVSRNTEGSGCPYCARQRVLEGINDLQTLRPEVAEQWDYEKNVLIPFKIMSKSNKKVWWKCDKDHSWKASVCNRVNGTGCPYCTGRRVLMGFNDLQTLKPKLANEWDLDMNELMPSQVTIGSHKMVWWKCDKGHSWKAQIKSRSSGRGCPYCTMRIVLAGFNDLQTLKPELANEWHPEKNILLPSQITAGSNRTVWWKCVEGHSWKATVCGRKNGNGCPYCSGKIVLSGYNDLNTLNPQLSDEWDYEKNTLKPSEVTVSSGISVWWKCRRKGHSWEAKIANRSLGGDCPYCIGMLPYTPRCIK